MKRKANIKKVAKKELKKVKGGRRTFKDELVKQVEGESQFHINVEGKK